MFQPRRILKCFSCCWKGEADFAEAHPICANAIGGLIAGAVLSIVSLGLAVLVLYLDKRGPFRDDIGSPTSSLSPTVPPSWSPASVPTPSLSPMIAPSWSPSSVPTSVPIWGQLGSTLSLDLFDNDGTWLTASDASIYINPNGTIVAVGAARVLVIFIVPVFSGYVEVYKYNGTDWERLGQRVEPVGDELTRLYGRILSLTDDGKALLTDAISAETLCSELQLYMFEGMEWVSQRNITDDRTETIPCGIFSGKLSGDGSVIAYGLPYVDDSTGEVQVVNIDGSKHGEPLHGSEIGGEFGIEVEMTPDGTILAVASREYIEVFEFGGSDWFRKGQRISAGLTGNSIARYVSLSENGDILAVGDDESFGGRGSYTVYEFDASDTDWKQLGSTVRGEPSERLGFSVSLSGDGTVLASGANRTTDDTNYEPLRVFQLGGSEEWGQLGELEDEGEDAGFIARNCALSRDGESVACADAFNTKTVKVYQLE